MRSEVSLDDPQEMLRRDSGELLRATATAGAQVRQGLNTVTDDDLDRIGRDGPPRAMVVVGTGGSGICGDLLMALARPASSVPVVAVTGPTLPAWVGPLDLVVAISTSGQTRETLSALDQALRRGARTVGIGGAADRDRPRSGLQARLTGEPDAVFFGTADPHRLARVSLWALLTPLLLVADRVGVVRAPRQALHRLADRLDERALAYGPVVITIENEAKELALSVAETLPVVIGSSPLTAVIAKRMAGQLGANAKVPAFAAGVAEAISTYGALLDGPYARPADPFHDPFEDPTELPRLGFVVISGGPGNPISDAQSRAIQEVAEERSVTLRTVNSSAPDDLSVLADLISIVDFSSIYLTLVLGEDPWASPAIRTMRARVTDLL